MPELGLPRSWTQRQRYWTQGYEFDTLTPLKQFSTGIFFFSIPSRFSIRVDSGGYLLSKADCGSTYEGPKDS
ncbi:hypothetical protein M6B38_402240 [Iris pallida]|uniref:Uncharacterized protein n=2 Tax=Iris pallida TaxID=29817 RepID=A0AAX6FSS1_IRIPA|nr:hypothetical protein M6B38_402240 [Iris pallida]